MNLNRSLPWVLAALTFGSLVATVSAAPRKRPAPESDLATIEARRAAVDQAASLAKVETPESLVGTGLNQPFNPNGFGREARPVQAAATPVPTRSFGDREILLALAPKVQPKGSFGLGSNQLLSFGKKYLRAGDHITVNYEGQDYSLELVSFDNINFTLRLNHEEITRPIKSDKPEPKKP